MAQRLLFCMDREIFFEEMITSDFRGFSRLSKNLRNFYDTEPVIETVVIVAAHAVRKLIGNVRVIFFFPRNFCP